MLLDFRSGTIWESIINYRRFLSQIHLPPYRSVASMAPNANETVNMLIFKVILHLLIVDIRSWLNIFTRMTLLLFYLPSVARLFFNFIISLIKSFYVTFFTSVCRLGVLPVNLRLCFFTPETLKMYKSLANSKTSHNPHPFKAPLFWAWIEYLRNH